MTVSTLRPNSLIQGGAYSGSPNNHLQGAATIHAALSDDADSSYFQAYDPNSSSPDSILIVGLDDLSLPAAAVLKSIKVRVRAAGTVDIPPLRATVTKASAGAQLVQGNWTIGSSKTTLSSAVASLAGVTDAEIDGAELSLHNRAFDDADPVNDDEAIFLYEAYVDVTYVEEPGADVDAPTGTVDDTTVPTVLWTPDLDSDGGAQTSYEVKIFDDATYGGGGFDPDTSTPDSESGILAGAATSWQAADALADDTYRAYVRVAQTVNGVKHWSPWAFSGFTVAVDRPGDPSFTVTPQEPEGRMRLDILDSPGDATTDAYEIERSDDGGVTYAAIRTVEGDGIITADADDDAVAFDFEAPNGTAVTYRVRALHDYSGLYASSDWVEVTETFVSAAWWLKHPTDSSLNLSLPAPRIFSEPGYERPARQAEHRVLGRADPIFTTEVRESPRGELVLELESEQAALGALLDAMVPVLVQAPAGQGWPDRWVIFGNQGRSRLVDKLGVTEHHDALPWTEVARPTDALGAWPADLGTFDFFEIALSHEPLALYNPNPDTGEIEEITGNQANAVRNGDLVVTSDELIAGHPGAGSYDGLGDYASTNFGTRRNRIASPQGVTATGWAANSGETLTANTADDDFSDGVCMKLENTADTFARVTISDSSGGIECSAGDYLPCRGSMKFVSVDGGETPTLMRIQARFFDGADATGSDLGVFTVDQQTSPVLGAIEDFAGTVLAPAGSASFRLEATVTTSAAANFEWRVSDVMAEAEDAGSGADMADHPYCPTVAQLASGEAGWTGTAHASASDIGCFANGTVRTFVAAFSTSVSAADVVIGSDQSTGEAVPLMFDGTGQIRVACDLDAGEATGYEDWPPPGGLGAHEDGLPHIAAAEIDRLNDTLNLHLDGVDLGVSTGETAPYHDNMIGAFLKLGAKGSSTSAFEGLIGPVAVFSGALSAAEHHQLALAAGIAA